MKLIFLLLLLSNCIPGTTKANGIDNETQQYFESHFDFAGYIGYQFVTTDPAPAPIKSGPEIGFLINWLATDEFSIFTQFRLEPDHLEQSLAYGFVKYETTVFDVVPISIKAGKLRHPYGLYNADRLNPRTRPGNIAPQAMYWDQLRFALTSGYGVSFETNWGNLFLKYTIDMPIIVEEETESLLWFSGLPFALEQRFGGHQQFNIDYTTEDRIRLSADFSKLSWGHGAAGETYIITMGGEKRWKDWTFSLEGLGVFKYLHNSYGVSATIQYDINEYVTIHTNFNRYEDIFKEPTPYIPDRLKVTNDFSVGTSIHNNNWEMKIEGHVATGGAWVDFLKARRPEYDGTWYYGAASLVYHF